MMIGGFIGSKFFGGLDEIFVDIAKWNALAEMLFFCVYLKVGRYTHDMIILAGGDSGHYTDYSVTDYDDEEF